MKNRSNVNKNTKLHANQLNEWKLNGDLGKRLAGFILLSSQQTLNTEVIPDSKFTRIPINQHLQSIHSRPAETWHSNIHTSYFQPEIRVLPFNWNVIHYITIQLRELLGLEPVSVMIKKTKLRWFGHDERKDDKMIMTGSNVVWRGRFKELDSDFKIFAGSSYLSHTTNRHKGQDRTTWPENLGKRWYLEMTVCLHTESQLWWTIPSEHQPNPTLSSTRWLPAPVSHYSDVFRPRHWVLVPCRTGPANSLDSDWECYQTGLWHCSHHPDNTKLYSYFTCIINLKISDKELNTISDHKHSPRIPYPTFPFCANSY